MYACYHRGHFVVLDGDVWRYEDGTAVDDDPDRPCPRCGRPPLPTGEDACLGHIDGASAACCGHGVTEPYVMKEVRDG